MTTELDDRIRASLRATADRAVVSPPDLDAVLARTPPARPDGHRRVPALAAAAAFVLVVGGIGVLVARSGQEDANPVVPASSVPPDGTAPAAPAGPLEAALGPGALIGAPPEPGWSLAYFVVVPFDPERPALEASQAGRTLDPADVDPGPYVEYQFVHADGRRLQVSFYTEGLRTPTVTTPQPPMVEVRGGTGSFLEYGGGRYRVDWDEAGRTWEATGGPVTDLTAFVDLLARLTVLDEATWASSMPPGVADAVLAARAGQGVSWYPDKGTDTFQLR